METTCRCHDGEVGHREPHQAFPQVLCDRGTVYRYRPVLSVGGYHVSKEHAESVFRAEVGTVPIRSEYKV